MKTFIIVLVITMVLAGLSWASPKPHFGGGYEGGGYGGGYEGGGYGGGLKGEGMVEVMKGGMEEKAGGVVKK